MKFVVLAVLVVCVYSYSHPINQKIVDQIKDKATSWVPMEPEENPFAYKSIEEIKSMTGTQLTIFNETDPIQGIQVPDSFDSRNQWYYAIHEIRDQGSCGSCWAFGASEALSDRFAIASNGLVNLVLSPQYQVSCDKDNGGCRGGFIDKAWKFYENVGIPPESCVPFTSYGGTEPNCTTTCQDGSPLVFYKAKNIKKVSSIQAMKEAIFSGGPVEVGFVVYEDFYNYKEGIYYHVTGEPLSGHAVKAIGWGREQGIDYWIIANSWGSQWGEKGYFRIKMGDSYIESNIVYGDPVVVYNFSD